MSSSRHSQGSSPGQTHRPQSGERRTTTDRFLRPEDAYNMESGYFGASMSPCVGSRHGRSPNTFTPGVSVSTAFQQQGHTQSSTSAQQYRHAEVSRHASTSGSSHSSRLLTPSDDLANRSRHSPQSADLIHLGPQYSLAATQRSSEHLSKDKGKQRESERGLSRKQSASSRHSSGSEGGNRRSGGGAAGENLVSGVFIRY